MNGGLSICQGDAVHGLSDVVCVYTYNVKHPCPDSRVVRNNEVKITEN